MEEVGRGGKDGMGGKVEGVGKLEEMGGGKVEGSERLKKRKVIKRYQKEYQTTTQYKRTNLTCRNTYI